MLIDNEQVYAYVADRTILSATVKPDEAYQGESDGTELPWHIHLLLDAKSYSEQRVAYPLDSEEAGRTLVRELEERVAAIQDAGRVIFSVTAQTT